MRGSSLRFTITLLAFVLGFVALFYPVLKAKAVAATDYPEPIKIIQEEGEFVFVDGSSYYLFEQDGTFKSGPLGLSGREIEGTWKQKDALFVIEGHWGWINGASLDNDYRRLTLYVSRPESVETAQQPSVTDGRRKMKVYKVYFEIEGLQKIEQPGSVK